MTVKKLSDADKNEILKLYRETGETTSTLADRYGVSNSTISRLLKVTLPEDEYEALISLKRAARTPHSEATQTLFSLEPEESAEPVAEVQTPHQPKIDAPPSPIRRRRRLAADLNQEENSTPQQLQLLDPQSAVDDSAIEDFAQDLQEEIVNQTEDLETTQAEAEAEANTIAQMLGEDLIDETEDLDLDDDDDLEDDDEDEDEDDDEQPFPAPRQIRSRSLIQVLPLSEATLPRTCYLVIDRASELITRPLRDFGDLGQIPSGEFQQKTLPVFDNHRVARRFSTKRDRVIKIPDGRLLQKTRSYLQAKGITRLLVDGQVYSLSTLPPN